MNQDIYTLHRYFIWSDRMRFHFDGLLKKRQAGAISDENIFKIESIMYISLWYALMHVVIEGWEKLQLNDNAIDQVLLNKKNRDLLKNYRHGVFHFHKNYNDVKFNNFYAEGTTVEWIRNLRKEFSRWFLDHLQKDKKENNNGDTP